MDKKNRSKIIWDNKIYAIYIEYVLMIFDIPLKQHSIAYIIYTELSVYKQASSNPHREMFLFYRQTQHHFAHGTQACVA